MIGKTLLTVKVQGGGADAAADGHLPVAAPRACNRRKGADMPPSKLSRVAWTRARRCALLLRRSFTHSLESTRGPQTQQPPSALA